MCINKIKNFLKKIKFKFTQTSYSQAGEDAIIRFLFNDFGTSKISYLELGTNRPDFGNNTYWFYLNHSRGVCVEADNDLVKNIKKVRPYDKVINFGVSTSNKKEADFYVFNQSDINTFDKIEAKKKSSSGKYRLIETRKVNLISVNNLLNDFFDSVPDLLSIDIEGLDLDVLKSLDFNRFPIRVICCETCSYSENHIRPKNNDIINFMKSKNYEVYADTYINTIFVNKNWFYSK